MTNKWMIGATAATLFAAMSVAPVTIANAQINKNPAADYSKCVGGYLVGHHWDVNTTTQQAAAAMFDCCILQGWQWVGTYPSGYCDVPNTSYGDPGSVVPPRTAILPPGSNTRAGVQ